MDVQFNGNVEAEVKQLCDALVQEATDLKAKSPTATMLADGMPILMAFGSSFSALGADMKSAEALAYVGLSLGKVAGLFLATAP